MGHRPAKEGFVLVHGAISHGFPDVLFLSGVGQVAVVGDVEVGGGVEVDVVDLGLVHFPVEHRQLVPLEQSLGEGLGLEEEGDGEEGEEVGDVDDEDGVLTVRVPPGHVEVGRVAEEVDRGQEGSDLVLPIGSGVR